ncbi:MAG: hypothetical protein WDO70_09855 [Alphaproteobacteria bacterium]
MAWPSATGSGTFTKSLALLLEAAGSLAEGGAAVCVSDFLGASFLGVSFLGWGADFFFRAGSGFLGFAALGFACLIGAAACAGSGASVACAGIDASASVGSGAGTGIGSSACAGVGASAGRADMGASDRGGAATYSRIICKRAAVRSASVKGTFFFWIFGVLSWGAITKPYATKTDANEIRQIETKDQSFSICYAISRM